jgi:SRSO17 transposase
MQPSLREQKDLYCPNRWGLPASVVTDLGARLHRFWQRFHHCFTTRTRDSSRLAHDYLRAQLTMERARNFTNIERRLHDGDGQRLQHFMSYSPWSGTAVFQQIRREIVSTHALRDGGTLILDESADEKASDESAGVSRQYNGRMGKVDFCRVDTCLIYANLRRRLWTMIDGELFIAQRWFSDAYRQRRERTGIPRERTFATKLDLGLRMIERCRASGLRFDVVACDSLYGRDRQFRAALRAAGVIYAAQVPASTVVRLGEMAGRYVASVPAREVRQLARRASTVWRQIELRDSERGVLRVRCALMRVRVVAQGRTATEAEWLVIRQLHEPRQYSYTLLNAPADTPLERVAELSARRYFVERTFQDAKSELGWAEFSARRYRAWEHHLALTAAALWFVAQTKLEWEEDDCGRDAELAGDLRVRVLPALSTANLRELLRAVLPLVQLTPAAATRVVVRQLVQRARATGSRLRKEGKRRDTS